MTDPKVLRIESSGYLYEEPENSAFCSYRKCEIAEWDDYYNFEELGEGIICEFCISDWTREFIVRGSM